MASTDVMMSFTDQNLAINFLSKDEIKARCPLAYAEAPTSNRVSEKYVLANTATVIEDMEKLGWKVVDAKQRKGSKTKNGTTRFSFHMIVWQNPNIKIIKKIQNPDGTFNEETDMYPRIILTTSHDGLSCFTLRCACFRLVCSNGLIIASDRFGEVKIRHINYTFEELQRAVNQFVEALPEKVELFTAMKGKILSEEQKAEMALKMLKVRKGVNLDDELIVDDETVQDILTPVRKEDEGNDLWTIFNIVQEKMIKGGFNYSKDGTKVRKMRKVTGFIKDLDINLKFWEIAESYL